MRPIYHFSASIILGLIIWLITKSWGLALLSFLIGFLIDLDHLIDYWALKPEKPFSPKDFLDSEKYDEQQKYLFIFAHAWEWVIILLIISWLTGWNIWVAIIALSIAFHLILDIFNIIEHRIHPLGYFITYRIIKKFRKEKGHLSASTR